MIPLRVQRYFWFYYSKLEPVKQMFFEKFANLFGFGTNRERKEQHNDEKTDISAAVGGAAG
jgi:hypothetical protein